MGEQTQWDIENIKGPARAPKGKREAVRVRIAGTILTVTKTGACRECGERIMYAVNHGMWFHAGFVKGSKTYQHQGRPR